MPVQFADVPGFIGLLDEQHQPLGDRQPCRFSWTIESGAWSIQLLTAHRSPLSGGASYVAIYHDAERMFTLPIVTRGRVLVLP